MTVKTKTEELPEAEAEAPEEPEAAKEPEAPAAEEPEAEAAAEPEVAEAAKGWRRRISPGRAISGALVAALAVLAVLGCWQWRSLAGERAERAAVERAADRFGTRFLSYDHRDVDAAKNAVTSLITGDFAESYRTQFEAGVVPSIKQLEARSTARVRSVYVGEINGNLAAAVVIVDSEMHTKAWTKWTTATHLDLKLIKQRGHWLVTDMTSAGALDEKMVDPSGKPITAEQQPAATK
ncbi:hypothetical protein [Actinocorallia longicatena]|uniref:Mce-associated membrane protein n=1 Tax=Actinocorallia longicatena TaxID=111803 RepID=A0ABP6Q4S3_9ACTN